MKTKDFLGQICLLKPSYLKRVAKCDANAEEKDTRPYLIVKLTYNGKDQLFALPFQTNIKPSLSKNFWFKMPRRLETMKGLEYGIFYCVMIPITEDAILRKRECEKQFPKSLTKQNTIFDNLVNWQVSAVPQGAQKSFEFLKNVIRKHGMSCFGDVSTNSAYAKISVSLYSELIKHKDNNLVSIITGAQNYLDNHYFVTLQAEKDFVDMPLFYTNIQKLMSLV